LQEISQLAELEMSQEARDSYNIFFDNFERRYYFDAAQSWHDSWRDPEGLPIHPQPINTQKLSGDQGVLSH